MTVQIVSRRTLKILAAVYLFSSLAVVAATHFLGQAVLESMVGLVGVLVLGVS